MDRNREGENVRAPAARRRRFELPGIQDLSKEQEAVRALPGEGQHLVVGGPGTGKTVVTLIRARHHQREQKEYVFLVFKPPAAPRQWPTVPWRPVGRHVVGVVP